MTTPAASFGLSVALATPFRPDGKIDHPRIAAHARWCLENGCRSITAFGTTGEGASIGPAGREQVLGAMAAAGINGRFVVGGISASSVPHAVAQARSALDFGCNAVLLPPPFYFKGVCDDGLFAWFAAVFEGLGGAARDVLLYNIPSVTQVGISVELIGRLRRAFPEIVLGVKDSSGDEPYARQLLANHGDLTILIGDERFLAEAVRGGGRGAISGLANVCPEALRPLAEMGEDNPRIIRLVEALLDYQVIPAVKALIAHRTGDHAWLAVRPPLVPLGKADLSAIADAYNRIMVGTGINAHPFVAPAVRPAM
jgi:4-hydroxy-tetrahydrodipicolinate synthase